MPPYARPSDLKEALGLLAEGRLVLAGGTDIYPAMQGPQIRRPVLDITALPALRGIARHAGGLRIGACTTWAEIIAADLPPACAALKAAAAKVGGRQIQNAGTLGGNLCNASPAADGVPPLLVLDAEVELASLRGSRWMPLVDFLTGPRQTARAAEEVLIAVHLPAASLSGESRFLKLGARRYLVISIAMVAVRLLVQDGRVTAAALAVGACSATARRLRRVEQALIHARAVEAASRIDTATVAAELAPMDDLRASSAYRSEAAAELIRRALTSLVGNGA